MIKKEEEKRNESWGFEEQTTPNSLYKKYTPHPHEEVDYSYVYEQTVKSVQNSMEEYYKNINKDTHMLVSKTDSIVESVIHEHIRRAKMGKQKYNADLDRTDLSLIDYLQHAKEEAMDLALYLEKAIQMLKNDKI